MSQSRCKHDFLRGECGACKPRPERINETVFTTRAGQVFHNWPDCAFLRAGQTSADNKGFRNHPVEPRNWSAVFWDMGPCEWCCAFYNLRDEKPIYCEAKIGNQWIRVQFIKERFTVYGHREVQVWVAPWLEPLMLPGSQIRKP